MVGSEVSVQRTGALEGAVAKTGSVASRSYREFKRVKPCSRESACALARRFKLSEFGHRPQAAGPIRASVRGGAPPMSRLSGVEFT